VDLNYEIGKSGVRSAGHSGVGFTKMKEIKDVTTKIIHRLKKEKAF